MVMDACLVCAMKCENPLICQTESSSSSLCKALCQWNCKWDDGFLATIIRPCVSWWTMSRGEGDKWPGRAIITIALINLFITCSSHFVLPLLLSLNVNSVPPHLCQWTVHILNRTSLHLKVSYLKVDRFSALWFPLERDFLSFQSVLSTKSFNSSSTTGAGHVTLAVLVIYGPERFQSQFYIYRINHWIHPLPVFPLYHLSCNMDFRSWCKICTGCQLVEVNELNQRDHPKIQEYEHLVFHKAPDLMALSLYFNWPSTARDGSIYCRRVWIFPGERKFLGGC